MRFVTENIRRKNRCQLGCLSGVSQAAAAARQSVPPRVRTVRAATEQIHKAFTESNRFK